MLLVSVEHVLNMCESCAVLKCSNAQNLQRSNGVSHGFLHTRRYAPLLTKYCSGVPGYFSNITVHISLLIVPVIAF